MAWIVNFLQIGIWIVLNVAILKHDIIFATIVEASTSTQVEWAKAMTGNVTRLINHFEYVHANIIAYLLVTTYYPLQNR